MNLDLVILYFHCDFSSVFVKFCGLSSCIVFLVGKLALELSCPVDRNFFKPKREENFFLVFNCACL